MKIPPVILASKSPRRQELLRLMNVDFRVVLKEVDESYPEGLTPAETAVYIAEKKAHAFDEELRGDEIVLTADTIVCIDDLILGKPADEAHAVEILTLLAGRKHEVITGVALLSNRGMHSFYDTTEVYFAAISTEQILSYIRRYQPFDKAGAYGIQDWIGICCIKKIVGSYQNVAGLPTQKLYAELKKFAG